MSGVNFSIRFISFSILALTLFSCGLKYIPGPSLEDLATARKTSLEAQLSSDFASAKKVYKPLTYGETAVIKPESYKQLDSLFELKYQRSNSGLSTKDLEPQIESQKMKLLADTTEVLYMETHWFELIEDSVCEFVIAQCFLNNRNILRKMIVVDQFETDKSNQQWAERYMKEDWLTRNLDGYVANEDLNFYSKMKNKAFNLQGEEKAAFLQNVFLVMRFANENKSLSAQGIALKLGAAQMKQEIPGFKAEDYTFGFRLDDKPGTEEDVYIVEAVSNSDHVVITRRYDTFFMPLN